jgi:hypothetical protein
MYAVCHVQLVSGMRRGDFISGFPQFLWPTSAEFANFLSLVLSPSPAIHKHTRARARSLCHSISASPLPLSLSLSKITVQLIFPRHRRVCRARDASRRLVGIPPMSEARPKLTWNYHYRCSGEILVRSEVRKDFCCPWCSMYTGDLSGLICHLTCSHSQYQFACGGTIAVRV